MGSHRIAESFLGQILANRSFSVASLHLSEDVIAHAISYISIPNYWLRYTSTHFCTNTGRANSVQAIGENGLDE